MYIRAFVLVFSSGCMKNFCRRGLGGRFVFLMLFSEYYNSDG